MDDVRKGTILRAGSLWPLGLLTALICRGVGAATWVRDLVVHGWVTAVDAVFWRGPRTKITSPIGGGGAGLAVGCITHALFHC